MTVKRLGWQTLRTGGHPLVRAIPLAEGWAFGELAKTVPPSWQLHYWRAVGGAEMDFVIRRGGRVIAVEVKTSGRPGLSRSVRSFIDAYAPECVVLAGGPGVDPALQELGSTVVRRVPLPMLAEVVEAQIVRGG